jgi:hypothetical protein
MHSVQGKLKVGVETMYSFYSAQEQNMLSY